MSGSVYGVTNAPSALVTPFQKFAYSVNREEGKKLWGVQPEKHLTGYVQKSVLLWKINEKP